MAQSVIGALRANLGLDSAHFEKGQKRAKTPIQKLKQDLLAITGVATVAGAALVKFALSGAKEIDEAAKSSRRLGSSVAGFRALELAAGEAGVNLSSITNDIQTLDREIASIGVTGNGARALKALGLSVEELAGLDADEKIARIADQVQKLGLSTGKTTAILRDLGVRNREMVLLVSQGGDAIRKARRDIEDYGLAISRTDASRIERANDALARLSVIGRYIGQRLALEIVPALGDLAVGFTDAMRAGGGLRQVVDFLIDNMGRLATYVGTFVSLIGVRFVAALVAAKVATVSLSGALVALRGALVRTGIGALVVGAGELVYWFGRLVRAAGGWGNALTALGDLAAGVWQGVWTSAQSIGPRINAVWELVKFGFFNAMSHITEYWAGFLGNLGMDLEGIPGLDAIGQRLIQNSGQTIGYMSEFDAYAQRAAASMKRLDEEANSLRAEGIEKVVAAARRLRDMVSSSADGLEDSDAAVDGLVDALNSLPSAAEIAAQGLDKTKDKAKDLDNGLASIRQNARSAFADVVTGAKSMRDGLVSVLNSIARRYAELAFDGLFDGLFGGSGDSKKGLFPGFGKLFGFANGTNSAPGGLAMVGERGKELVNLPKGSRVHTATETRQLLGGSSSSGVLRVLLDPGLLAQLEGNMQNVAVETASGAIQEYDQKILASRVNQITADPLAT